MTSVRSSRSAASDAARSPSASSAPPLVGQGRQLGAGVVQLAPPALALRRVEGRRARRGPGPAAERFPSTAVSASSSSAVLEAARQANFAPRQAQGRRLRGGRSTPGRSFDRSGAGRIRHSGHRRARGWHRPPPLPQDLEAHDRRRPRRRSVTPPGPAMGMPTTPSSVASRAAGSPAASLPSTRALGGRQSQPA